MEKKSLEDLYTPEMESTLPLRMCKLKAMKIKSLVRKGVDKKGKPIKPTTIYAAQDKLRRSQKPYRAWVAQKYQQLENQPQWLRDEWEEFFHQTLSTASFRNQRINAVVISI